MAANWQMLLFPSPNQVSAIKLSSWPIFKEKWMTMKPGNCMLLKMTGIIYFKNVATVNVVQ